MIYAFGEMNIIPCYERGVGSLILSRRARYFSPGDGIGIRVGLRNQILGVRLSSGAPNLLRVGQVDPDGLISHTERGALPRPATSFIPK